MKINIHEAKTHLSRYAAMVKGGETIILCDRNVPFAEIRPITKNLQKKTQKRPFGLYKGLISTTEDFDWTDGDIKEMIETRKPFEK